MPNNHVIIIGAGIGGLSAAIRLAARGCQVTILEKNSAVGGKMSQISADNFRFDTGPSVVTMRHVFEQLFAEAGRQLDDYLTLLPVDPFTRYFYPNGTVLDVVADEQKMADAIHQIEPDDVDGYRAFLKHAAELHRITGPVFIYDRPPTLRSFLKVPVPDWFKVAAFRSMDGKIKTFVKSAELRQLFGRFATYVGASPYQAPATLNVIADVEVTGGVWYPKGGIYQIAAAFEQLALELGVTIHTSCAVKEILIENGRAVGCELADGTQMRADAILSNVDVTMTFDKLVALSTVRSRQLKKLQRGDVSCSGFILLLGIDKTHSDLAHHNIWFSADYKAEFDAIFQHGQPPSDPTIYAAITSKTDPDHAPAGCENWFILINAPAIDGRYDWEQNKQAYRDNVLQRLAGYGVDLRPHIVSETILTPHDIERMSGAKRGALYGASSNDMLTAFRRPHNRSKQIPGLYFAGGTTHPGGGVPMVTLSGKVAADLISNDLNL